MLTLRQVLALAFLLSGCSLLYELAIAASFVRLTGDAPLWQSLTLGLYLAAVGAGTWSCAKRPGADPGRELWRVELALAAVGGFSAAGILSLESAFRVYGWFYAREATPERLSASLLVLGHAFTVAVGWLSGFELPLLLRLARSADGHGADTTGRVLGANYAGALAASLAFAAVLHPRLEETGAAAAAGALNLAACAWLWSRGVPGPRSRPAWAFGAAALAWIGTLALIPAALELNAAGFFAHRLGLTHAVLSAERTPSVRRVLDALWERRRDVERRPSDYQRIELVNAPFSDSPWRSHFNRRPKAEPGLAYGTYLYLDRRFQFYGGSEAVYHEYLAHVPIQLFRRVPADVLILGGGDGLLAGELLKYPGVRSVTNVELDPAMASLALEPRLAALNRGSFRDPRVRVVIDDAFTWVRTAREKYDAAYIDLPYPFTYDVSKLYTVEFLRGVSRRLKPGGFAALDFPLVDQETLEEEGGPEGLRRNSIAMSTLRAAGALRIVPYSTAAPELMPSHLADRLREHPPEPDPDPEVARLIRRVHAKRFLNLHRGVRADETEDLVLLDNSNWQETMIAFSPERLEFGFEFRDHGIELHALNARRLRTLEGERFPTREDRSLVNSVARPVLFRALRKF